jgi:hypothetical protein
MNMSEGMRVGGKSVQVCEGLGEGLLLRRALMKTPVR